MSHPGRLSIQSKQCVHTIIFICLNKVDEQEMSHSTMDAKQNCKEKLSHLTMMHTQLDKQKLSYSTDAYKTDKQKPSHLTMMQRTLTQITQL